MRRRTPILSVTTTLVLGSLLFTTRALAEEPTAPSTPVATASAPPPPPATTAPPPPPPAESTQSVPGPPAPAAAPAPSELPPETPPMEPVQYEAPRVEPEPIPGAHAGSMLDRFSGSYVDWWHRASVEYLGVGPMYGGVQDFSYTMGWSLSPSFFAYREGRHQVRIRTSLAWSVEMTNSNTTLTKNELELADLPLSVSDTISLFAAGGPSRERPGPSAGFNPTLEGGGEYNTWLVPSAAVVFPTSKPSQIANYVATNLGLALRQRIKLLGGASPGLQSLTLALGESWRHNFNKANVPVGSTTVPRQAVGGGMILSDQASKWLLTTDRLSTSASAILPLYKGLELSLGFSYLLTFKPKPTSGCIDLATGGCADPSSTPTPGTTQLAYTDLDIELAYRPIPELVIDLGYETFRSTVNAAGRSADVFYGPGDSTLYADIAFLPVELLKRFQRPAAPPEPPVE